jgi:apolipoprotein D and lipocalin family protein
MVRTLISILTLAIFSSFSTERSSAGRASAVTPFDKEKYLGRWYEIARLDYRFEKDLNSVTATYSLRDDGMIKVDNRGYDTKKGKWKQSVGKAKFAGSSNVANLKVSFFGPFYSEYNVIAVDKDYRYALVAGESLDYLWILSRFRSIPDNVKKEYLEKARELGYKTEKLVWVDHSRELVRN